MKNMTSRRDRDMGVGGRCACPKKNLCELTPKGLIAVMPDLFDHQKTIGQGGGEICGLAI